MWATRAHELQQQNGTATSTTKPTTSDNLPPCDLTSEPIYGTKYNVTPIPKPWMQHWTNGIPIPGLHLPSPNPFVPDDLSMKAVVGDKEGLPDLLVQGSAARVWQRTDLRFESPKATLVLDFQVRWLGEGHTLLQPLALPFIISDGGSCRFTV